MDQTGQTQPAPDQPATSTPASSDAANSPSPQTQTQTQTQSQTPTETNEQLSPSSGAIDEQTDSPSLPPHERDTITRVPVTPEFENGEEGDDPGRFGDSKPTINPLNLRSGSLSSGPVSAATVKTLKQSHSGIDLLKKAVENNADMATRRESLSDIRENNPDLALSGNIISATFNIPHSLEYRKGADWVSQRVFGCRQYRVSRTKLSKDVTLTSFFLLFRRS